MLVYSIMNDLISLYALLPSFPLVLTFSVSLHRYVKWLSV